MARACVPLLCLLSLSPSKCLAGAACSSALLGKTLIPGAHLGEPVENAELHRIYCVEMISLTAISYPEVLGKHNC